tara:strand:+ start:54 stop:212 length:159 start_codon:yes stop_codon:yes gene_type:complete
LSIDKNIDYFFSFGVLTEIGISGFKVGGLSLSFIHGKQIIDPTEYKRLQSGV